MTKTAKPANVDRAAIRMIDWKTVSQITSLHRATLYAMARSGEFPAPIKLAKRRVAWREADVLAWLEARPAVTWAA